MIQHTRTFKAGEVIYKEGDQADNLYIIKSGVVRLCRVREKRILVLATLFMKEIFGSEDVFKKSLHTNNAVALEDVELVEVSANDIREQVGDLPDWIGSVMETLATRLDESESVLEKHKIYDSELNESFNLDPEIELIIKENLL